MIEKKAVFGIVISEDLNKELRSLALKGADLKVTRSEVVEEMLILVLEHVEHMETFVELLRGRIIERRKQKAQLQIL